MRTNAMMASHAMMGDGVFSNIVDQAKADATKIYDNTVQKAADVLKGNTGINGGAVVPPAGTPATPAAGPSDTMKTVLVVGGVALLAVIGYHFIKK